ncbi:GDSL-type esterase/lipase family protein [Olivibacter sp. XZL3]|uniref:GDSL-type esterase/lipase family protein n=1 Tax=Olivibacter sp. XZL3 TaxID=1735116 RepID=UPI0010659D93|nr:GDSL-type esterase/lipase family protein [Olivibacter sp. XZL3]
MENKQETAQWEEEIAVIKQRINVLPDPQKHIAFYGSSSFRLWTTMEADLYPLETINMGFGGSTYKDCIRYFDDLFSTLSPMRLVLYGGDNDIANGEDPETIRCDVRHLTQQIRSRFPNKALSVISIKPSPARTLFLDRIQQANQMIKQHLQDIGGGYIDVYSAMLDANRCPNKKLFTEDELHLNEAGYQVWASLLKEHLMADS